LDRNLAFLDESSRIVKSPVGGPSNQIATKINRLRTEAGEKPPLRSFRPESLYSADGTGGWRSLLPIH
jgi:hypothetical protein